MLRNCVRLVIAHMVDATKLCLSCHCTHGGCYATMFVLSLHTWWMLRNCVCLELARAVGWGGDDDILWTWTHGGCYATMFVLSLHTWWMLRNCVCLELARAVGWGGDDDILWTWTHGGCYATMFVLSLHTWWMLRNCVCLVTAHMVDATQLCLSCHCTHGGCKNRGNSFHTPSRIVETVCSTPGSGTMSISLCKDTTKTCEKPPGEAKRLFA